MKTKKALSPLVATAILLSAAMAGGLLLYQYFNNIMNNYTTSENILLTIHAEDTGTGNALIVYTIKNAGNVPVNLSRIIIYEGDNIVAQIELTGIILSPGQTIANSTIISLSLAPNLFAILEYDVRGQKGLTQPVTIRIG